MTGIKFLSATVLLALIASSASAQPVIDEPGMFAFVYPNGDLGIGTSRPPADAMAMAPRLIMRHPLPARHAKAHK
jgi:hypothetical protein